MLGVIVGLVILGAAALQAQLAEQAAVLATLLLPHVCSEAVTVTLHSDDQSVSLRRSATDSRARPAQWLAK
jgi:hypothetical protein